jgi:hypothetical protein
VAEHDEMMVVHFVGFQEHEIPETFPYRLAELHTRLAAAAAARSTPEDTCEPKEPRKKTLAGRLRYLLRWWHLHLVSEPILAAFETVLGRVPARVYKLWHTGNPVLVKSRFWAAVHGLVHIGIGCCVIKVPNWLSKWHEQVMDKAYLGLLPSSDTVLQSVVEAISHRVRLSILSDAQIAHMLGDMAHGKYTMGTETWEVIGQVVSRLNRAKGGPLLETTEGEEEEAQEKESPEPKTVEQITVAPSPPTKPPEKVDDMMEHVPTPSYEEFIALMEHTVGDQVPPEQKEKKDG